ncbi:MAG TPA: CBS domain-containing protein, partial [Limnochordales bacterium]
MRAGDIMRRDVRTTGPDATVEEVAAILAEASFSGLPVVDDEGRVVGMVTEADLLARAKRLNLPKFFPFLGGVIYLEHPRRFEEELRKATAARVRDVMTTDVVTVTEDAPLEEVATLLVERGINRLPVVREGRLVGII